ncbi:DUF2529 family protein [Alkalihalobacillus sp. AL-G]|uniref:DUF2529 family protein n=1 Tax=Alkalihalobacillus sp. AL-G TaxID=2926399 RepID=UPI00272A555D|nr:DUF2529 family protein [Alkalihalobacillus sp. AL-G]WLD93191.1 DUF2529 domain-containing protein [Alkalihalobacillus sp. AL-G]
MLKIFTTQLFGVFRNIQEKNEEVLEDCSRLLAQTITADGTVFVEGLDELEAVSVAAITSEETLPSIAPFDSKTVLEPQDCLIVFAKTTDDERLKQLVEVAGANGASIISIGAMIEEKGFINTDFHIDTTLLTGLVPTDEGDRSGYPVVMCTLYVFHALVFTTREMLEEYDGIF